MAAVNKLGYHPNPNARALMTTRSGLVGFWMSLHYSRYRSQVLSHMRGLLGATDMALAVTDIDEEYHWNHSFSRALRVPVEGIIAFDASATIDAIGREHGQIAPGIPIVSMGAYWSEATSYVAVDLKSGAYEAMDHLLGTGRRKIAYMAPWCSDLLSGGDRFEAYRERMTDAGHPTEIISARGITAAEVQETLLAQYGSGKLPEAILCMNDDLAIAASVAISNLGARPGHDVGLVGFDGIAETELLACPITTVAQPIKEMCSFATSFLRAQMDDPRAPRQQKILKPNLIIRDSTRT